MAFKLGINTDTGHSFTLTDAAPLIKQAGFDACFTGWNESTNLCEYAEIIAKAGLIYQSVHSPFGKIHTLWEAGEAGEVYTDMLIKCIDGCKCAGVPIMVVHPTIGMNRHDPAPIGLVRFGRLVEHAEKTGVKLAFENVECNEYLDTVMKALGGSDAVGFCWDTGHEMCYNFSNDMTALYGSKLIATHFNDNLAMADPNEVTWLDDSHLMPFDGVADWQGIMNRIQKCGYTDTLTFELTKNSKPGKSTHDIYADLSYEEFLALAYTKARKVSELM